MCGIAGLLRRDGGPIDRAALARMSDALAHRGPDGASQHVEPGIGLAHRRLAVIDLETGAQPMANADGSAIVVFNGEIYNFPELRRTLERCGHVFRTTSDTETILLGWAEWGEAVLDRLDGMFAIALFDRRRRRLFLARDRFGKKPLHMAELQGGFAFASELAAFSGLPGLDRRIAPASIDDYLALGYVPDPATVFAGIARLPPAHALLLDLDRFESGAPIPPPRRWWHPNAAAVPQPDDPDRHGTLRAHLLRATEARLIADVRLGAFLSGGLDSASVVAAAMRARPGATALATFTIGFPGADDETAPAAAIARHVGASHRTQSASAIDWIAAAGEQGRVFGEPFGDPSAVPTARLARFARAHVTVALSGDGGDEVFAGYRRHRWHLLVEAARRFLPDRLREGPIATLGRLYPKLDRAPRFLRARHTLTELGLSSALGYYRTMAATEDERRRSLLHPRLRAASDGHDPAARFEAAMREHADADPLAQALHADLATWLPGRMLAKVDRTSMRHGLEVRSPLLDHRLVEWGLPLAPAQKIHRGRGKRILREAVAPWLPADILARPKQGFSQSLGGVLRAGTDRVRGILLAPRFLDAELVEPLAVARLIDEHGAGRLDHAQPLWLLLVLAGFVETELNPA